MTKICPDCGETFDAAAELCPYDGAGLEAREHTDPHIGRVVDERFRLDALIGEGGMGRVYEATQLSVGRQVAVKMIRIGGLDRDRIKRRFFREAKVVSELTHPNIVTLLEFGEDDELEVPYIAMEYIDGLDVRDALDEGRLHPRVAVEIALQIAAALVEAHEADIIHRDLKTDNVLLVPVSSGGFQAKVIDFGIALPKQNSETLTNSGMICGTPKYVSPEQARNSDVDARTDLYSLGVVLYEMLTGELPFESDSALNVMMKHIREKPPTIPQRLGPEIVPGALVELVDDLLEKDRERRPPDARAVRRRLKEIQSEQGWAALELDTGEAMREKLQPWILPLAPDTGETALEQTAEPSLVAATHETPPPAFSAPSLGGSPFDAAASPNPVESRRLDGTPIESTTPAWSEPSEAQTEADGQTEADTGPQVVGVPRADDRSTDDEHIDPPRSGQAPATASRGVDSRIALAVVALALGGGLVIWMIGDGDGESGERGTPDNLALVPDGGARAPTRTRPAPPSRETPVADETEDSAAGASRRDTSPGSDTRADAGPPSRQESDRPGAETDPESPTPPEESAPPRPSKRPPSAGSSDDEGTTDDNLSKEIDEAIEWSTNE